MATGSPTPNFQPTLAYTKGNFEIGVWGSTDFVGSYKEVDPYVSLSSGQFKFVVTDYNWNLIKLIISIIKMAKQVIGLKVPLGLMVQKLCQ